MWLQLCKDMFQRQKLHFQHQHICQRCLNNLSCIAACKNFLPKQHTEQPSCLWQRSSFQLLNRQEKLWQLRLRHLCMSSRSMCSPSCWIRRLHCHKVWFLGHIQCPSRLRMSLSRRLRCIRCCKWLASKLHRVRGHLWRDMGQFEPNCHKPLLRCQLELPSQQIHSQLFQICLQEEWQVCCRLHLVNIASQFQLAQSCRLHKSLSCHCNRSCMCCLWHLLE